MGSRSVLWKRALPLLLLLVLLPLVLFFGARALGGRAGIEGLELAEQWLDALRARQRLDELLVGLLEGGLNAAGRSREGAQAPSDG